MDHHDHSASAVYGNIEGLVLRNKVWNEILRRGDLCYRLCRNRVVLFCEWKMPKEEDCRFEFSLASCESLQAFTPPVISVFCALSNLYSMHRRPTGWVIDLFRHAHRSL